MKTNTLRSPVSSALIAAMMGLGGFSARAAVADKADEPANVDPAYRQNTGRKVKSFTRDTDTTTSIPLAGCLTPRALKARRAAKGFGFEARAS